MTGKQTEMNRRCFLGAGPRAAGAIAAAFALPNAVPAAQPPSVRITDVKFLRLRFPGRTPRIRNAIIESGGGPPGMTQLELYTDQGIVGRSIPAGATALIESELLPRILGENPFFVERIWDRMYRYNRKPVAKGEYIRAMGAVDMAVRDIVGKALELPVYKLMGAFQDEIRVYAAGGYYEEGKTVARLVKEMVGYVSQGFRAVKMKVGGESSAVDVERVRAVREALGLEIDIMIDANGKWQRYEAIRFGRAVEEYNPSGLKKPSSRTTTPAARRSRRRSISPSSWAKMSSHAGGAASSSRRIRPISSTSTRSSPAGSPNAGRSPLWHRLSTSPSPRTATHSWQCICSLRFRTV